MTKIFSQYMHSKQKNAPKLDGMNDNPYDLLQLLDVVLDENGGFNELTPSSIAFESNYIKFTFTEEHGYLLYQTILISNANDSELNGRKRIVDTTTTEVFIERESVGDLSGAITTKVASLGWENMFPTEDVAQRAYRSKNVSSTRTVLYLNMNKNLTLYNSTRPMKFATVSMCSDMTTLGKQINSYTDPYNNFGKYADGRLMWISSSATKARNAAPTTDSNWIVFGDDKIFYLVIGGYYYSAEQQISRKVVYCFGDTYKLSQNDMFNCILSCSDYPLTNSKNTTYYNYGSFGGITGKVSENKKPGKFFISDITGLTKLMGFDIHCMYTNAVSGNSLYDAPNPLNFSFVYVDMMIGRYDGENRMYGGNLPYVKAIANRLIHYQNNLDYVLCDKHFLFSVDNQTSNGSSADPSYLAIDLFEERNDNG